MSEYARGEFERRFLLDQLPTGVPLGPARHLDDRYITGTRLRLRLVRDDDGFVVQRKLGDKRRVDENDPSAVMHTSIYLDSAEYDVLATLPADTLSKTRRAVELDGVGWAVDEFHGRSAGLIMLEVELRSAQALQAVRPPPWAGREVTGDDAFSGGRLAARNG